MGVTLLDITVGTKDFRQALQSVLPHAHTKPDEWPELARLRCHVDRQNLMVSATDRYTAAIGLCSVWSDDLGAAADIGVFDLALDQAKKILAVFKLGGKSSSEDDEPEWQLRIQFGAASAKDESAPLFVRLTDVSGFIPGEQLEMPALPVHDQMPKLPETFAKFAQTLPGLLDVFGITGTLISRFKVAAAVYNEPLLMTSMGSTGLAPMLVRCGDSFLGCVTPRRFDEDQALKHKEWLQDWIHRLPPPASEVDLNPTRDTSEERTDDAADD